MPRSVVGVGSVLRLACLSGSLLGGQALAQDSASDAPSKLSFSDLAAINITQQSAPPMAADQLTELMRVHPNQVASQEAVCESLVGVDVARTRYYPKITGSLNSGDKMVDKTTRSDEFGGTNSPEYDGEGVNLSISVRQMIYDWGATRNAIKVEHQRVDKANLQLRTVAGQTLFSIMESVFNLEAKLRGVEISEQALNRLSFLLDTTERKFKAGAGTLTEVREITLSKMQRETRLSTLRLEVKNLIDTLANQYGLDVDQAAALRAAFIAARADLPVMPEARETVDYRQNYHDQMIAKLEHQRLLGERWPKIDAELVGRAWDVQESDSCGKIIGTDVFGSPQRLRDKCNAYEVTGNLNFTVPLFDGGENKNRRKIFQSQARRFEYTEQSILRDHSGKTSALTQQYADLKARLADYDQQIGTLKARLEDLSKIQEQTQSNVPVLASMVSNYADLLEQKEGTRISLELVRARIYDLSDQLLDVMNINLGLPPC